MLQNASVRFTETAAENYKKLLTKRVLASKIDKPAIAGDPCCRRDRRPKVQKEVLTTMAKISGKYEIVYILDPALGEEGIAALVEKFKAMVEAEGTLTAIEEVGKRRLAYPINDLPEGYYVVMNCECKPELPAELDRVFKITDGVMRSLIVAIEE